MCYNNLKKLHSIRHYLNKDIILLLAKTLIINRIDYCNILLANANDTQLDKLQKFLSACMRFVYNLRKSDHTSSYLRLRHILPIRFRIMFKCRITIYNILNGLSPDYLDEYAQYLLPHRANMRSSNQLVLKLPECSKCLQYTMIRHWNKLPLQLRSINTLDSFKSSLKTYYFRVAYPE